LPSGKPGAVHLLDGGDARQRQEEAEMVMEIGIGAGDRRIVRGEVFGLERLAIGRENEAGFSARGGGAGAQSRNCGGGLAWRAGGNVDVVGLKDAAQIGLVRHTGAQAFERGFLVPESLKELEGELLPLKGFFGQFGNGLFNFNGVHWSFQGLITRTPQPSKSLTLRVAMGASVAREMAAIWQSASAMGRPTARRWAAISA
jgi:hypothetical protein